MKEREQISVMIKVIGGKTVCICKKGCDHPGKCEPDVVERDRFRGWQSTMHDKYGR